MEVVSNECLQEHRRYFWGGAIFATICFTASYFVSLVISFPFVDVLNIPTTIGTMTMSLFFAFRYRNAFGD